MAVLVTGGTGKTSSRLSLLLQKAHVPFLIASTRGPSAAPPGMQAVAFNWNEPSTYSAPFAHFFASNPNEKITSVYLVGPQSGPPGKPLKAFIDVAIENGVKRFVLLTGSSSEMTIRKEQEEEVFHAGDVWRHLEDRGVGYVVLRATWFMENMSSFFHVSSIKHESKIYSACEDGKIPFVSTGDIAAVAFRALTDEKVPGKEFRVLGPELLTYDQIAETLSATLGRTISHIRLSKKERIEKFTQSGVPEHAGRYLAQIEVECASGLEERMNDAVEKITDRKGKTFGEWALENTDAWV